MKIFKSQFWQNNLLHGENSREKNRARHYEGIPFEHKTMLTTLVMPNTAKVWGIDASHWNLPPINLARMRELYGLAFAIFKGCDGSLNTRYYPEHVSAAKLAGVPWGMYVWLYPNAKVSIDAQVNAWHARFSADPPPMGLFIDAEWTNYGGLPANPSAADLRSAHDKWRAKSGQAATTYTAKGYADTYLKGFDWSREELWVANYGVSSPNLPSGASVYTIWQFTSTLDGHTLDPNGNAELDGNYFNGTREQFDQRYGGTPPPPPNGGSMKKYRVVWPNGVSRRTAPTTSNSSTSLTPYPFDAVVDVQQDNIPDQTYPTDPNRRWVQFADGHYGASNYPDGSGPKVRMIDITPEPPPPDPEPGVTIVGVRYSGEVVFDYSNGTQEVWHISDAPLTKGPAL